MVEYTCRACGKDCVFTGGNRVSFFGEDEPKPGHDFYIAKCQHCKAENRIEVPRDEPK